MIPKNLLRIFVVAAISLAGLLNVESVHASAGGPSSSIVGTWSITSICSGSTCTDSMLITIGGQPKDPDCTSNSYCVTTASGFYGEGVSLSPSGGSWTLTCAGCTGSDKITVTFSGDTFKGTGEAISPTGADLGTEPYDGTRTGAPPPSLGVTVELATSTTTVGSSVKATVTVTASGAKVTGITLGGGLTSSTSGAAVAASSIPSSFTLLYGTSRTFTFKVKAVGLGTATLSATASGMTSTGSIQGSGQATLNVSNPEGIVVNTTSDEKIDEKALSPDDAAPFCAIDAQATDRKCSLRAAIELVNKLGGDRTIAFDIPGGGVPTIEPTSELPAITAARVVLDGSTQPGGWVELLGAKVSASASASTAVHGLTLDGTQDVVRGLVIGGFEGGGSTHSSGILVGVDATSAEISGDRIGTDASGEQALFNNDGIDVAGPDTVIGGPSGVAGTCGGDCDLLGNRVDDIYIRNSGVGTVIEGNTIGTDLSGEKSLGKEIYGIRSDAPDVRIGGETSAIGTGNGNLVGGYFRFAGIQVKGSDTVIAGNLIGVDRTGASALFPQGAIPETETYPDGVRVSSDATGVVIGGSGTEDTNVISGWKYGVYWDANPSEQPPPNAASMLVEHDLIGTNALGTAAVPNYVGVLGYPAPYEAQGTVADSVVSGNHVGVSGVVKITGDLIGTNEDGTAPVPNVTGVANSVTVGGVRTSLSCSDPCNLISGNSRVGIDASGTVQGNFIGTNLLGTAAIPNGTGGSEFIQRALGNFAAGVSDVQILGGPSSALTGSCDGACNLISGNDGYGIFADGLAGQFAAKSGPAVMEGNVIGRSISGAALPNQQGGVAIENKAEFDKTASAVEVIGGVGDLGNLIADNAGAAIDMPRSPLNSKAPEIIGNSITGNRSGITYASKADRAADAPPSPTEVNVVHVLEKTIVTRSGTHDVYGTKAAISGTISDFFKGTTSNVIQVYGSRGCEPGPQGAVPLAQINVGSHSADFSFLIADDHGLSHFTLTNTRDGSTSPFSQCVEIHSPKSSASN